MKKRGFTLSEILITLGIIGVVASMTVPTIVHKYSTSEYSARAKKAYGLVSQVFEEAWKDKGAEEVKGLQPGYYVTKVLRAKESQWDTPWQPLGGGSASKTNGCYSSSNSSKVYLLPDGSKFSICSRYYSSLNNKNETFYTVYIDVNGNKEPNTLGRDIYRFEVYGDQPTLRPYDSDDCDEHSYGYGCSKALIQNGWEIDW